MARLVGVIRKAPCRTVLAPVACGALMLDQYRRIWLPDNDPSCHCQYTVTDRLLTGAHIRRLERDGFVVLEGPESVLDSGTVRSANAEVSTFFAGGRFSRSVNGSAIRQDMVCWLQETDGTPKAPDPDDRLHKPLGRSMLHCMRLLRGIAHALDEHGYSGSHEHRVPRQLQLGWYPGDGASGYVRHSDYSNRSIFEVGVLKWLQASDRRARCLTAILYLNDPAWRPAQEGGGPGDGDGGELRCFHPAQTLHSGGPSALSKELAPMPETHTDIVPRGGTLIIFDARKIEHQVQPSRRDRFALTCWITGKQGSRPTS